MHQPPSQVPPHVALTPNGASLWRSRFFSLVVHFRGYPHLSVALRCGEQRPTQGIAAPAATRWRASNVPGACFQLSRSKWLRRGCKWFRGAPVHETGSRERCRQSGAGASATSHCQRRRATAQPLSQSFQHSTARESRTHQRPSQSHGGHVQSVSAIEGANRPDLTIH